EAMKAGCCIISTDVGGLPELITDTESGILVKPRSVSELSAALREAILNPTLREQLGRAAKEKFDQQFEQSAIFRMHSSLFDI
ncbi:MAG: glycosyltransferase, partial [Bacteriovorax sp.]|nr:glycosyltransferase [Bacteriovorax sp.]